MHSAYSTKWLSFLDLLHTKICLKLKTWIYWEYILIVKTDLTVKNADYLTEVKTDQKYTLLQ